MKLTKSPIYTPVGYFHEGTVDYNDLISILESINDLDFSTTPALRIIERLRRKLIDHDFDPALAEEIVASVDLHLPFPAEDQTLERISHLLASSLVKMRDAFRNAGFQHPERCTLICARNIKMSLIN